MGTLSWEILSLNYLTKLNLNSWAVHRYWYVNTNLETEGKETIKLLTERQLRSKLNNEKYTLYSTCPKWTRINESIWKIFNLRQGNQKDWYKTRKKISYFFEVFDACSAWNVFIGHKHPLIIYSKSHRCQQSRN